MGPLFRDAWSDCLGKAHLKGLILQESRRAF